MTAIVDVPRRPRRLASALAAVLLVLLSMPAAHAQASASASLRLSEALRSLARDPQYLPSLVAAGQASLALDQDPLQSHASTTAPL